MSVEAPEFRVEIETIVPAAEGVVAIILRRPDGSPLPAWQPGAHIDLLLPSGTVRQYSLCGDPGDLRRWRIAVLREQAGRGGSAEVHDRLRAGQTLTVRGPRNAFVLRDGKRYLFVAGGIGITPILPMVREAHGRGADWRLIYGGRSRGSMAFVEELHRIEPSRVEILPQDVAGLLDLGRIQLAAAAGAQIYCCGPTGLLNALEERFKAAGLAEALHVERFTAAPADGAALLVILARSGREVAVAPTCSILEALRAAGCEVPSSCEQGLCGTCETKVLAGKPDHRDQLLTEAERQRGDVMMVCVSRALTPSLTLDL
ncbi:PDR/VanB family oxidoreductase [Hypericibacter sp.]|uniref:PDR/VanB family oxidoreductase n=1 Tax=Hypericibacter sp. TaxID=2705401 RepID=UPI003D6C858C